MTDFHCKLVFTEPHWVHVAEKYTGAEIHAKRLMNPFRVGELDCRIENLISQNHARFASKTIH